MSVNKNQLTIYLPRGIQDRARELFIPLSAVCKAAILAEIERREQEQIAGVKKSFHRADDTPELIWMDRRNEG